MLNELEYKKIIIGHYNFHILLIISIVFSILINIHEFRIQ